MGDEEILCNRIVDVVVAIVGWWIIVIIFICGFIPWISSKNAYDEWIQENLQMGGYQQSSANDDDDDTTEDDTDAVV